MSLGIRSVLDHKTAFAIWASRRLAASPTRLNKQCVKSAWPNIFTGTQEGGQHPITVVTKTRSQSPVEMTPCVQR